MSVSLQGWSFRTLSEFRRAPLREQRYGVNEAENWREECVHRCRGVIHNDYASLSHKEGKAGGRPDVARELLVPVFRGDRIVAILGVANKSAQYLQEDLKSAAKLADLLWDIVGRKRAEERLKRSEEKWRNVLLLAPQAGITLDPAGKIAFANEHFLRLTGWEAGEALGRDWFENFIPREQRVQMRGVFERTMASKAWLPYSTFENEILTRSGQRLVISWRAAWTVTSQNPSVSPN